MPSGKTHDLVTVALAPPTFAAAWGLTGSLALSAAAAAGVLFGGLMFGPDLDIQSRQYTRWGPLRFLWWPYKVALPHRSRLSHSILLGTWVRIIYFLVVLSLTLAVVLCARDFYQHRQAAALSDVGGALTRAWGAVAAVKRDYLIATLVGLWIGATSHTVADVLGSFFKSVGRSI